MSVEIMANGADTMAVMFCNTSGVAFGPVHRSKDYEATEELLLFTDQYLAQNAREYKHDELMERYRQFLLCLKNWRCDCGAPALGPRCPTCQRQYERSIYQGTIGTPPIGG